MLSEKGQRKLKLSGNGNECKPLPILLMSTSFVKQGRRRHVQSVPSQWCTGVLSASSQYRL
jgi:hypothetical protein